MPQALLPAGGGPGSDFISPRGRVAVPRRSSSGLSRPGVPSLLSGLLGACAALTAARAGIGRRGVSAPAPAALHAAALRRGGLAGRRAARRSISAASLACRHAPVCCKEATEALDALITRLRQTPPEELGQVMSENYQKIDQQLFLRLAQLCDETDDAEEKLRIQMLSSKLTTILEDLVAKLDQRLDKDKEAVQNLLRTLAREDGECGTRLVLSVQVGTFCVYSLVLKLHIFPNYSTNFCSSLLQ